MSTMNEGGMLAVIGSEVLKVKEIFEANYIENIDIANYNSHQQIVLSGKKEDLEAVKNILQEYQYHCIMLPVSGAFHSRYMADLKYKYLRFLVQFNFNEPKIPVISSASACVLDGKYIFESLGAQLVKPVKWMQTVQHLQKLSVTEFVEIGPGQVLSNLNKKILGEGQTI